MEKARARKLGMEKGKEKEEETRREGEVRVEKVEAKDNGEGKIKKEW